MTDSVLYMSLRINRYIVGCKSDEPEMIEAWLRGINRYIVGCKL